MFKTEPGFRKLEFKKECYAIAYIILKFINKNKYCIYKLFSIRKGFNLFMMIF